jgi:hypothetical protein
MRRFDAAGIRRGLRQSIDGGSGAAPAPAVTLDDLWAEWGGDALWWWQGGVGLAGGAWADRVEAASMAITSANGSLSSSAISGVDAVAIAYPGGGDGYAAASATVTAHLQAWRAFVVVDLLSSAYTYTIGMSDAATYAPNNTRAWAYADSTAGVDLIELYRGETDPFDPDSYVRSNRTGTTEYGAQVIRWEHGSTNASHVYRVNGSARGAGTDADDIGLVGAVGGGVDLYLTEVGSQPYALICAFPHAAMTDPQAAQFETDLLTIMGL